MAYRIEGCVCFQCFFGVSVNHFKFGRWGIMIQFQIVSSISMWVWLKTVDAPKFKMGCFKFYQDSLPWAISRSTYGDFQTWGVPQNGCFLMDNPSINGWFRGTPISIHGLSIINHYFYQSSIYNGQSIYKWFIMFPHFRNPPFQYMACFKFLSLPKPEQPWEQFHKLHRYPGEPWSARFLHCLSCVEKSCYAKFKYYQCFAKFRYYHCFAKFRYYQCFAKFRYYQCFAKFRYYQCFAKFRYYQNIFTTTLNLDLCFLFRRCNEVYATQLGVFLDKPGQQTGLSHHVQTERPLWRVAWVAWPTLLIRLSGALHWIARVLRCIKSQGYRGSNRVQFLPTRFATNLVWLYICFRISDIFTCLIRELFLDS